MALWNQPQGTLEWLAFLSELVFIFCSAMILFRFLSVVEFDAELMGIPRKKDKGNNFLISSCYGALELSA